MTTLAERIRATTEIPEIVSLMDLKSGEVCSDFGPGKQQAA